MNMIQMSEAMRNGSRISLKNQIQLIIALSIPAILEQLVMTMMSYIDTAMVGSLGQAATAAIGVVSSSIWLLNGITNAVAVGFSVQVAQYLGAGREKDGRSVLCQAILFNALFGMALSVITMILSRYLPTLLGADMEIRPAASEYFKIVGLFLPFSMASAIYSSILRCSGNVVLPSCMNVGMCILDVIFNFVLIYPTRQIGGITVWGAGLGVAGAALGTGLAQMCVGLSLLLALAKKKGPLCLTGQATWKFTKPCMSATMRIATPTALERITLSVAQIVMTAVIAEMGTTAMATNYVAVQTESICYLPAYGVAAAATALVGQSIGAERSDMAKRFACGTTFLGFLLVTGMGAFMFLFAPQLTGLLTSDPEVAALSAKALRIVAFSEPLFAVSIVVIGALRGAGDSKGPFILNLCSMWGVRVLAVLLFARSYGVLGVWGAMTAELCFRGIVFLIRLMRGRWLHITRSILSPDV